MIWGIIFLSTLPARGATTSMPWCVPPLLISIHAPREGSDPVKVSGSGGGFTDFYPRSPRGERPMAIGGTSGVQDFYPRSPRGERRRGTHCMKTVSENFYPRSPRGERRPSGLKGRFRIIFLSTLPARGATCSAGKDYCRNTDFYPRSPRGERPVLPRRCKSV